MLQKSGNISITGTPGSGKTALLKMFVKEAIELGKYDSIRVYTSKVNRMGRISERKKS